DRIAAAATAFPCCLQRRPPRSVPTISVCAVLSGHRRDGARDRLLPQQARPAPMAAAQLGWLPDRTTFDTVMVSARAGVHPEMHPAAYQVPPRRDRDGLADDVQV